MRVSVYRAQGQGMIVTTDLKGHKAISDEKAET
jgi:hypothetical protein